MSLTNEQQDGANPPQHQLALAIRNACVEAALQAYEDAGFDGLCHEGAWEVAVDAMRSLDVEALLASLAAGQPQPNDAGD